jgi:tetratricopeptide (TPR) repeat protein
MTSPWAGVGTIGQTIGHYRILQKLGAGGMGQVFLAHDERLRRDVAVKVLAQGVFADAHARRLFRSEALTLSRINHPNVETIYEFDTVEDLDVLVLEHVAGTTLAERVRAGPLPEGEIVRIGMQIAAGLVALHGSGVVHRDLKPANLRVTPDGLVKILDLGLATLMPATLSGLETQSGYTQPGGWAGTPMYMAPEQVRGEPVDARTDIYAAGAVLYEMCAGRAPFNGRDLLTLTRGILEEAPAPPRVANPAVSPELERIILKALDKDRDLRYQSARELLVDLERLVPSAGGRSSAPSGPPDSQPGEARLWRRLSRLGLVALAIAAVSVTAWRFWPRHVPPPRPFAARDWVLVADFDAGGQPALEQALREALTVTLQQSRYVNVLPRERTLAALKRMARPASAVVDRSLALELARRENVAVILLGALAPAARGTRVSIQGVSVADDRTLFSEQDILVGGTPLQSGVDVLAAHVRRDLGESLEQIQKARPLAEVTTPSMEALQRYSRGADELAKGNVEEAGLSLRAAVALDPGFAMAHQLLARVCNVLGDSAREREHLERAWALRNRLTDRERLVIEAAYASLRGDFAQSLEALQTLVGLYPDDAAARFQLGKALSDTGSKTAAVREIQQALRIDPHYLQARGTLVPILMEINRPEEGLRVFEDARVLRMVTPDLEWARALALFGADRIDEAREAMTAIVAKGVEPYKLYGELYLDRILIYRGQFAAARTALRERIDADEQAKHGYPERLRRYLLGRLAALAGDAAEVRRQADAILGASAESGELRVEHIHKAGELAVLGGDLAVAELALSRLRAVAQSASGYARSCELHLQGEIERARGRVPQAIDALGKSAAAYPNYLSHRSLGMLYEEQHRPGDAVREWEQVAAARGEVLRFGFPADWVLAEARLARLYAAAGDQPRAQASCSRVAAAWLSADSTPVRQEALAACGPRAAAPR